MGLFHLLTLLYAAVGGAVVTALAAAVMVLRRRYRSGLWVGGTGTILSAASVAASFVWQAAGAQYDIANITLDLLLVRAVGFAAGSVGAGATILCAFSLRRESRWSPPGQRESASSLAESEASTPGSSDSCPPQSSP